MSITSTLRQLQKADRQRPAFPAEHWLTFGAGVLLLLYASRRRGSLSRWAAAAAGTSLVARAAGGRDGLRSVF